MRPGRPAPLVLCAILPVLGLAACPGPAAGPAPPAPTAPAASRPAPPPPRGIGSACKPGGERLRGDCPEGQACMPLPGGLCTASCGVGSPPCPDGSRCVDTARAGGLCLKACEADATCRSGEGYTCHEGWRACSPPGLAAIQAPRCAAGPALPRGAFGPPQQITSEKGPGLYHFEPTAALDARGNVVTVFIAGAPIFQPNTLGTTIVQTDGSVGDEVALGSDKRNHFDPWLAADRKGRLHLVWLGHDGGSPDQRPVIGYASSADGRTWTAPRAIHDAATDCPSDAAGCLDKPMIAVGPDPKAPGKDALHVFYYSEVTGGLRMVRSTDGGATFGASVAVAAGAYGDVDVAADGSLHVVTVNGSPRTGAFGATSNTVEYVRSTDGGATWSQPIVASASVQAVPFFFSNPQVAWDARRKKLYVAYPAGEPDGKWDIVLASSGDAGATWTRVRVNDDEACAIHMIPALVLDPRTGALHLTWNENRGGVGRLVHATCEAGGAACAANRAVSDVPFAAFSLGRHLSTWQGEYNALVLDPKRRLLHAVWSQTVAEDPGAVGRIFTATAKLK